ncbi:response regulator transcription factor [Acanthopleuribacter pedis]|uniref:Response regulator transcription factor n=1 Tax=Acanthopleuribacter pedis TaxID=442870 RepID=A0A8J7QCJ3_9BACT|nr:response regulator transcription factor [Acanthopleuribacter pedis]MBO1321259.1 response regulator transcription factor [Acanthopleuribacter pedis]
MPHILLVEDDMLMADLLVQFLESEGFTVDHAPDGPKGVEKILARQPDLVILDLMMPGLNGLQVCKQVRPQYPGPIIMLTAVDEDLTEVTALNTGIDDFITKPFRSSVLLARMGSLLRRAGRSMDAPEELRVQNLTINAQTRTVSLSDQPLPISDTEFELLWFLMEHAGKVLNRDMIYKAIKGIDYDGLDRSIDMRISCLRKKLKKEAPDRTYIKTVWGRGYLVVPN